MLSLLVLYCIKFIVDLNDEIIIKNKSITIRQTRNKIRPKEKKNTWNNIKMK